MIRYLGHSHARVQNYRSLQSIRRDAWNACFPGEVENYDYLSAVERAGIEGFKFRYFVVETDGKVLAAMPSFLTAYGLDTTMQGAPKRWTEALRKYFPSFLVLKLACLGSPETEHGMLGFHPDIPIEDRSALLRQLLDAFEAASSEEGVGLLGIKDIPETDKDWWTGIVKPRGYRAIPSLPQASLKISFNSVDEYFSRLSSGTRKDLRRKLKSVHKVRVEQRRTIDDVLEQVEAMYLETKARSNWQFETLTAKYFRDVLAGMHGNSLCFLYYGEKNNLIAINLLLANDTQLLDKFLCMYAAEGRRHNIYFLSWLNNIQHCIEHNLSIYHAGQAAYETKLRLGCELTKNWIFFRHRSRVLNGLLKLFVPLVCIDQPDKKPKRKRVGNA